MSDAITELGHLEETVTSAQFHAAIRLLAGTPQIHVLAQRRAFPVACYLAYALSQLELRTHLLDSVGGMLSEFVRGIAPRDVLLAHQLPQLLDRRCRGGGGCHRRGVSVIAITDSADLALEGQRQRRLRVRR